MQKKSGFDVNDDTMIKVLNANLIRLRDYECHQEGKQGHAKIQSHKKA